MYISAHNSTPVEERSAGALEDFEGPPIMFPRHSTRWRTTFGKWVSRMTVARIVEELSTDSRNSITPGTVYEWVAGHQPRPDRALALVRISGGELSLDDIYRHRTELAEIRRRRRPDR